MSSDEEYRRRFASSGWSVFERALYHARRHNRNFITTEHLVQSLTEEELFKALLNNLHISMERYLSVINKRLASSPDYDGSGVKLSADVKETLKRALERARSQYRDTIRAADILVALSQDERGTFMEVLRELGIEDSTVINEVRALMSEYIEDGHTSDPTAVAKENLRFSKGDMVRIKSGVYSAVIARVHEVDENKAVIKATVRILGEQRTIELEFSDVEKLSFSKDAP